MRYHLEIESIEQGYRLIIEVKKKIIEHEIGKQGQGIERLLMYFDYKTYNRISREVMKSIKA